MRTASVIELTDEQRQQLQRWTRSSTVSVRLARRARMILLAAEGMDNHQIAGEVGVGRVQVGRWRRRFAESGLAGIESEWRQGPGSAIAACCGSGVPMASSRIGRDVQGLA